MRDALVLALVIFSLSALTAVLTVSQFWWITLPVFTAALTFVVWLGLCRKWRKMRWEHELVQRMVVESYEQGAHVVRLDTLAAVVCTREVLLARRRAAAQAEAIWATRRVSER